MANKIECNAEEIWSVLGRTWALLVLKQISQKDATRFNEIKRAIPQISNTVLSDRLHELEDHGLISKKVFPEVPIRVEYSLTRPAKELGKILEQLDDWVIKRRKENAKK